MGEEGSEKWDYSFGNGKSLKFISEIEPVYSNVNSFPASQSIFHALMQLTYKRTISTLCFFKLYRTGPIAAPETCSDFNTKLYIF